MNSYNADKFYAKISKHILLAKSFTEIKELEFIIKSCRLKPYNFIQDGNNKLSLHRWWFDEFGNSLKIVKNKRLKIIYNDLSLDKKSIVCTDLYYGLTIDKIIKISKLGFFFFVKEEDYNSDSAFLCFLGIDNYLRCFMYLHDTLTPISPLYLGINNLKLLHKYLDIKYYLEIKNNKNLPIPCNSGQAWLSYIPFSDDFSKILNHQPNNIVQLIKGI